jgi:DNA polymerase III epsilon subunit-like protein
MRDFKDEFIVFDVETTGLSPSRGDRIIEVAALRIKDLKPVASFSSLVNSGREIARLVRPVNADEVQELLALAQ